MPKTAMRKVCWRKTGAIEARCAGWGIGQMGSLERGVAVIRQNRLGLVVSNGTDGYDRARMREVAKLALLYFLGPRVQKKYSSDEAIARV